MNSKRVWKDMEISRVRLKPEQAVLSCCCGVMTAAAHTWYSTNNKITQTTNKAWFKATNAGPWTTKFTCSNYCGLYIATKHTTASGGGNACSS